MDVEKSYFEDLAKNCRFNVIVGGKGSGKTHLLISLIKLFMSYNVFQRYFLYLPEFETEADDQYEFLKHRDDVQVYTTFDDSMLKEAKKTSLKEKSFLALDDSTDAMFKNKHSEILTKIITTTRHGAGLMVYMCLHGLSNILLPQVRANMDYLFLGKTRNAGFLEKFHKENLSLVSNYNNFANAYVDNVINKKYNFLFVDNSANLDFNVKDWELLKYYDVKLKQKGRAKIVNFGEHKKIVEKVKKENIIKSIRDYYQKPTEIKSSVKIGGRKINF